VKPFLVWSEEHGAWWRPGRAGYTRSIREAGRYSLDEAAAIVENANRYVRDGFNEVAVFDPMQRPEPQC
jgi:hypothetical protein